MTGARARIAGLVTITRLIAASTVQVLSASVDSGSRANARHAAAALRAGAARPYSGPASVTAGPARRRHLDALVGYKTR